MIGRVLAVLVVLQLAACGGGGRIDHWTGLPPQMVGAAEGDTVEVVPGAVFSNPATVISVVRAFDYNGKLALCGALGMAAPTDELLTELETYATDPRSLLWVGEDRAVPVSPRFMKRYKRREASGVIEAKDVDLRRLEGACIATGRPWRPDFRSANWLDLRKLVGRRGR